MDTQMQSTIAQANLKRLTANPYPGRIIILGMDETGENMVQIYAVMGRSANSRNRVMSSEDGRVFTEPADPSKVEDPSLIIYNAMTEVGPFFVVSNGHQTDAVVSKISEMSLYESLEGWLYEPDKPNYTPRITGASSIHSDRPIELAVIRRLPDGEPDLDTFQYDTKAGFGEGIMTYQGDGDPLPSFQDVPWLLPLTGDIHQVRETYWNALNPENRVSMAIKFIPKVGDSRLFIVNRFEKV
ncbi:MAG TPA: IMP cyclohydrolase [Candidatus Paceibacterota bacterium]